MQQPCANKTDCLCEDDIIQNFSAEPPDQLIFFPRVPYGWPGTIPPLSPWRGFYPPCASSESQDTADLCAARKGSGNEEQTCTVTCPSGATASYTIAANQFFGDGANETALAFACQFAQVACGFVLFRNAAKSCDQDCPGGGTSSYTTPANYFTGLTQAEADAAAEAFACRVALLQCDGPVPIFFNQAQTCGVLCQGGQIRFTLPAGLISGTSQAEANETARNLACLAAQELCDNLPQLPPQTGPIFSNTLQECTVSCSADSEFTYVVLPGLFTGNTQAEANAAADSYACLKAGENVVCPPSIATTACLDELYDQSLAVPNGQFYELAGTLPPGLGIFGSEIIGVPDTAGTYTFTVQVTLANGSYTSRDYTIRVAGITSASPLANGERNTAYSAALTSNMNSPVWSVSGGSLPPGMSLSSAGVLSGTPTIAGVYNFTITATEP